MSSRPLFVWLKWIGAIGFLTASTRLWAQEIDTPLKPDTNPLTRPDQLPFGVFPSIEKVQRVDHDDDELTGGIKNIQSKLQDTVKTFATRRNMNCLRGPCLIQAFPIIYVKRNSGFFGGIRANLRDSLRGDPPFYSITTQIIRSDTDQWLTFLSFDFPKIESIPFEPRFRIKGNYSRTTGVRYFGIGTDSKASEKRDDSELRFGLEERSALTLIEVPVMEIPDGELHVFGSFATTMQRISRYDTNKKSKLFEDAPRGIEGGTFSKIGLGTLVDTRDRELMTRLGWAFELSGEVSGEPIGAYSYQRFTLINRKYYSYGRQTIALRTTVDSLHGEIPFWELEGVGGLDPIRNVSGSGILRAYKAGRYHEKFKVIQSTDFRHYFNTARVFGQFTEITWVPFAFDVGRLGPLYAWDAITGFDILMNRSFLIRTYFGYARTGFAWSLTFDQEF